MFTEKAAKLTHKGTAMWIQSSAVVSNTSVSVELIKMWHEIVFGVISKAPCQQNYTETKKKINELSWEVEHVQKKKLLQFGADGHLWRGVGLTGLNVYALRDSFSSAAVDSLTISDIYNTYLILLSEWKQSTKDSFKKRKEWMKTWFCGIVQTILWSSNHVAETQRL